MTEIANRKSQIVNERRLAFFERYLTIWVFLCMIAGVSLGKTAPGFTAQLSRWQFGRGSQVNVPIGVLLWLMIYPMMIKVDFSAIGGIARKPKGLAVTLFVNWLIKPFSMASLATVVGVLVEVPVMLSVCRVCNQSRDWYQSKIRVGDGVTSL